MTLSSERLSSTIQRILPNILSNLIKDEKVHITITEVRVSKDLSIASIYFCILDEIEANIKDAENTLLRFKGQIKKAIASEIRNLRKMPDLNFIYDKSLQYGNKINNILNNLKK